jgi:hypothetical protein
MLVVPCLPGEITNAPRLMARLRVPEWHPPTAAERSRRVLAYVSTIASCPRVLQKRLSPATRTVVSRWVSAVSEGASRSSAWAMSLGVECVRWPLPNSATFQTDAYLWRCWLLLAHCIRPCSSVYVRAWLDILREFVQSACIECMHGVSLDQRGGCQPQPTTADAAPTTIARRVRAVEMKRLAISPVSALTMPGGARRSPAHN